MSLLLWETDWLLMDPIEESLCLPWRLAWFKWQYMSSWGHDQKKNHPYVSCKVQKMYLDTLMLIRWCLLLEQWLGRQSRQLLSSYCQVSSFSSNSGEESFLRKLTKIKNLHIKLRQGWQFQNHNILNYESLTALFSI